MTKENSDPKAKLILVKAFRSTIGSSGGEGAPEEHHRADRHDDGADEHRLILEPVIVGAFLEHIFQ